jgi:hypothetical protein
MSHPKDVSELTKNLSAAAEARRKALGIARTEKSAAISAKIGALAGRQSAVIEWTIRPKDSSETVGVACGCFCGCSCIA